ncbi:pentapeptide repeat-containing protein [Leptothoe sp. EHU-05/26/07-4]
MPWNWKRRAQSQKIRVEKQREHIKRVAHELYQNRILLNRLGDAQSDWETATKIVQSDWQTTLFASNRPLLKLKKPFFKVFKFIVWDSFWWLLFSAPKLEWVKLLAVPLVLAGAGSIISSQFQREANQNATIKEYFDQLDTLTFQQGLLSDAPKPGAIVLAQGRTVAALRQLDISRKQQLISFLLASGLSFSQGDGTESIISFKQQNLSGIDFRGLDLTNIDFQGVYLDKANLQDAYLGSANFQDAYLESTNFQGAYLGFANFQGAYLGRANLQDASFWSANLQDADLFSANLEGVIFLATDLRKTRSLSQQALNSDNPPLLCNSPLPKSIKIKGGKDRDCDQIASAIIKNHPGWNNNLEDAEALVNRKRKKTWD